VYSYLYLKYESAENYVFFLTSYAFVNSSFIIFLFFK
jgi:hypothetical protein